MSREIRISRRTVLRGMGTAMALPFLEATWPARALAATDTAGGTGGTKNPPLRMAFLFTPNGVNTDRWAPSGDGRNFRLGPTMESLEPFKEDLLVLTGLTHDKGRSNGDGPGDHARSASVFLTGAQPYKTSGAKIRSGISVDQIAAQHVGRETRFPSLELGCDRGSNSGSCDSGYGCAYSHNISWASPSTPVPKEIDPRRVFNRLFEGGDRAEVAQNRALRARRKKSILDFVLGEATRLRTDLGHQDRRKLDEYLAGVREVEQRVVKAGAVPTVEEVEEPEGLPTDPGHRLEHGEHIRILSDLMVLAFQGDVTRISSFMYARAASNRSYRSAGVRDGHHNISHHGRNREKLEKIGKIDSFHVTQFSYLLERLRSIPEGDGTLLDNCMIVYGSGICDGNRHSNENLPVILAGKGGGTIDTGRHIRYEYETPLNNLYLSILDRMGVNIEGFGDSTGRLPYLAG